MIYPIFIPSKGRPNFKTFDAIKNVECHKYLFIEPQDENLYSLYRGLFNVVLLPENNQGIAYSRQYMKKFAEQVGYAWFWSLDDDIQGFFKIQADAKLKKTKPEYALKDAQEIVTSHQRIGIAALNFGQYAFGQKVLENPITFNRRCIIATLNNVDVQRNFQYDMNCKLKEDIDFSLQILTSGYRSMICNQIAITVPVNGTLKGGCFDEYERQSNEKDVSRYLESKWGSHLLRTYLKKNGQFDVKINWEAFK